MRTEHDYIPNGHSVMRISTLGIFALTSSHLSERHRIFYRYINRGTRQPRPLMLFIQMTYNPMIKNGLRGIFKNTNALEKIAKYSIIPCECVCIRKIYEISKDK